MQMIKEENMSDNNGHRTLRRVLLIALAISVGLFLRYNHAYFFQHGMFQRQQSDYHMHMITYEDAGLTLQAGGITEVKGSMVKIN